MPAGTRRARGPEPRVRSGTQAPVRVPGRAPPLRRQVPARARVRAQASRPRTRAPRSARGGLRPAPASTCPRTSRPVRHRARRKHRSTRRQRGVPALGSGDQLCRRGLDGLLGGKLCARIELVRPVVPAERVDDDLLALSTRSARVEQVSEQEVQRAIVATVVDGQGAGRSLCLHRLQQRREPAVTEGTLGLHGCGSPVLLKGDRPRGDGPNWSRPV